MKNNKYVIGIDPGHGGSDPGASSPVSGITESTLTLELSLMVKKRLEKLDKFEVCMTRTDNTNPGNASERGTMLGTQKCDYAVSIHFNAFNTTARGTEIYVPNMETYGTIEYYLMNDLTKIFKARTPVCKGKNYSTGAIYDKSIDSSTLKFKNTYNVTNYYGVIRNAWSKGVSCDLLEVCFCDNPDDYALYIDNKSKVADIIASAICKAYGVEYSYSEDVVENPNVGTITEKEYNELISKIDTLTDKVNNLYEENTLLRANIKKAVDLLEEV